MPIVEVSVAASTDDCYYGQDGGAGDFWNIVALDVTAGITEFIQVYGDGSGMRFLNVTVPQGATITKAYLVLKSKGDWTTDVCNSRITGEDVDDAATFSDKADFKARRGTVVGGENDNFITTAQVDWDAIPHWSDNERGANTTSPEIKTIIQEIVNRPGWASGQAMVLFWDDYDQRSTTVNALRLASSWDDGDVPPLLHIEYTPPPPGWQGKISGVTNPAKVMGVAVANIAKVKGVASA